MSHQHNAGDNAQALIEIQYISEAGKITMGIIFKLGTGRRAIETLMTDEIQNLIILYTGGIDCKPPHVRMQCMHFMALEIFKHMDRVLPSKARRWEIVPKCWTSTEKSKCLLKVDSCLRSQMEN